jgi:hypothetical protein
MLPVKRRTVVIALSPECAEFSSEGAFGDALGYLASWAHWSAGRYDGEVSIFGDSQGNLHAAYRDSQGNDSYALYAQRDHGTRSYSFQS